MIKNVSAFIQKVTWKKVALCTVLFVACYWLINFSPIGVAGLLRITQGPNILDFEFGYTYHQAEQMLVALGESGRQFYLSNIILIDLVFPVTYALCYFAWISLLLKHQQQRRGMSGILALPMCAMLFDWMENLSIICMLRQFPTLQPWAVTMGSVFGVCKFVCTISCIAAILLLAVVWIVERTKNKRAQRG